jgi:hypothetical protein
MVELKDLGDQMWFFIYLLEHYAAHVGRDTGDVLRSWDEAGIAEEVFDGYFQYHQERIENAYEDIESLIAIGSHAYESLGSVDVAAD